MDYVKTDIIKTVDNQVMFKDGKLNRLTLAEGVTLKDSSGVTKLLANPTAKTIADGAPTSLADVACAANTSAGGMLFYLVQDTDATDFQAMSGMVAYSMVNKAGTNTLTITDVVGNNAKAVSAGTITLAWTFVTGTGKGTIKLQPTGSLTETVYTVSYTVFPIVGVVTIL
jgi:hypothetical protein